MSDLAGIDLNKPLNLHGLLKAVKDIVNNLMTVEESITLLASGWTESNGVITYNYAKEIANKYKSITVDVSPVATEAQISAIYNANIKSTTYDKNNQVIRIQGIGTTPEIDVPITLKLAVLNSTIESMQVINNISVDDYEVLLNQPMINGHTLIGNKTATSLGITYGNMTDKPSINGVTLVGNKTFADLGLTLTDLGLTREFLENMGVAFLAENGEEPTFEDVTPTSSSETEEPEEPSFG